MKQLKHIQSLLEDDLARMNSLISQSLATPNPLMDSVVTEYLKTKGKQLRPILVMLSAHVFGSVTQATLYAAAALEMLHNASLIHDDVVDDTMLRRCSPTINAVNGNHLAVLIGDFFVSNSLSVGILTGNVEVVRALADLGKELSLGEVQQICNVREHNFDYDHYFATISAKTASLFRNCVRMGAETNGADAAASAALVEYGEMLGLCFQIKDDILDYAGDASIGKPTGNDLREGKVTLPLLYALANGPREEADRFKALICKGDLSEAQIHECIEFAKRCGGITFAYDTMDDIRRKATPLLHTYPESRWRDAFDEIFGYITQRDHV